jgi:hypothetical protein
VKKKEIFADLGSNLTLNFGKLFVVMEEPQARAAAPESVPRLSEPVDSPKAPCG